VLQSIVAEHVEAVNAFDEDAIVATFADDAFVNDAHREFWGTDAIRRWVAKEMVGDRVSLEVTEVIRARHAHEASGRLGDHES
jgi:ketosteroid isomerase-like protein